MNMQVNDIVQAQLHFSSPEGKGNNSVTSRIVGELVRMRFQILGGLFFACLLPSVIMDMRDGSYTGTDFTTASTFGTVLAFLGGFMIFRKVAAFPGVRATSFIFPSLLASYLVFGGIMVFLRKDFSRIQLSVSFVIAVAFLIAVMVIARRVRRPVLSVIAEGDVAPLFDFGAVDWHILNSRRDATGNTAIVADLSANLSEEWVRFIADCALRGRPVYNVRQVRESLLGRVQIQHLSENSFGTLAPNEIYDSAKRYVDILLALLVLGVLGLPMVLVGLIIRLESRGPAIFRQQRMGHRGLPFTIYKFRTMRELAGDDARRHDEARITRFGSFLRQTRLDELPQVINIIRGEMSWIGPRPEAVQLSQDYECALPFYRYRHVVRPGISGWAQVHQGHVVGVGNAELKLQYDFFYIKNFSFWLDVLVLLKTFRVIVSGHGAR